MGHSAPGGGVGVEDAGGIAGLASPCGLTAFWGQLCVASAPQVPVAPACTPYTCYVSHTGFVDGTRSHALFGSLVVGVVRKRPSWPLLASFLPLLQEPPPGAGTAPWPHYRAGCSGGPRYRWDRPEVPGARHLVPPRAEHVWLSPPAGLWWREHSLGPQAAPLWARGRTAFHLPPQTPWIPFWFPHMTHLAWAPETRQPGLHLGKQPSDSMPGLCTRPGTREPCFHHPDEGTEAQSGSGPASGHSLQSLAQAQLFRPRRLWGPSSVWSLEKVQVGWADGEGAEEKVLGPEGLCTAWPHQAGSQGHGPINQLTKSAGSLGFSD